MDTQRQNFWKEAVRKEAYVRLAWHQKYTAEFGHDDSEQRRLNRSKKLTEMVPKPPEKSLTLPVINYPKKKPTLASINMMTAKSGQDPNALLVEMRAVTPGVRKLLYHGFTKEGKGRYQYLQTRKLKIPEDKYEFPLTSSWEIGWRLNDVHKEFRAPRFGRSRIVRDTFFRRTGILYDPVTA